MLRTFFFGSWPLFMGLFCIIVGNSIQGSLIAYLSGLANYSYLVSGLIISGYFLGMLASVFATPHFLNTVGHVRLFAALTAMLSATLLVFPLIIHPLVWFILRLIVGYCYVGLFIITEAWINALTTNAVRGRAMAFYMIVQFCGFIAGQILLGQSHPESPTLFLISSIGVSIAVVPMLVMHKITVPPQPDSNRLMHPKELYKLSPFALVGTSLIAMVSGILYASLGFFGQKAGLNLNQLATMTILVFIAAMISQWPVARLSDRIDRRLVIIGLCMGAMLVSLFGLGVNGQSGVYTLYLMIFLLSLAIMPLYSINLAHINDVVPSDKVVAASSALQLIGASGAFMGPLIMTGFMGMIGLSGFFLFYLFSTLALGAFAIYRLRSRAVDVHHHTVLNPMMQLQSAQMDMEQIIDEDSGWDISKGEKPDYDRYSLVLDIFRNIFKNKKRQLKNNFTLQSKQAENRENYVQTSHPKPDMASEQKTAPAKKSRAKTSVSAHAKTKKSTANTGKPQKRSTSKGKASKKPS